MCTSMTKTPAHIDQLVEHLFRKEAGRMTAILTHIFGFDNANLVEDIVQDTFVAALKTWPLKGKPNNPTGWLMRVAKNKTLNAIKRNRKEFLRSHESIDSAEAVERKIETLFLDHEIDDSQLRMLFACCHPYFPEKIRIALTLKLVCGFSNSEIARALMMQEEAIKKMIYRSRKLLRGGAISLKVPFKKEAEQRLSDVLKVCYLMFNEGYKSFRGDRAIKMDLCMEAIRLVKLMYDEKGVASAEAAALLSLMLFNAARFPSRTDSDGNPVALPVQDRSLWDRSMIQKGFYYLSASRKNNCLSSYHIEAGVASVHCMAKTYEDTDWKAIVTYYSKLKEWVENPLVQLNHAIALGNWKGPTEGLVAIENCNLPESKEYHCLFHAAKADMFLNLQDFGRSARHYRMALDLAESDPDRKFLESRIKTCELNDLNQN